MTAEALRGRTRRELETLARRKKVTGIRSMTKDQLVATLARLGDRSTKAPKAAAGTNGHAPTNGHAQTSSDARVNRNRVNGHKANGQKSNGDRATGHRTNGHSSNGQPLNGRTSTNGRTSNGHGSNGPLKALSGTARKVAAPRLNGHVVLHAAPAGQDRLFATAVDSHWYDVRWSLTPGMLNRAEAFFGLDWRAAQPAIRIYDVTSDDGAATSRAFVRDELLTEQTDRWFLRVSRPDRMWLFEIGLLGPKGRFFALAHGEPIGAPGPLSRIRRQSGARNGSSRHGTNGDEISPVSSLIPHLVRAANRRVNGEPAEPLEGSLVQLQAELVVHGKADPGSELRLMKDRIPLSREGTFSLRLPIENGRVVIPVEHVSSDGAQQRTVILAIERSTRVLETQLLDETAE